jgi:hypothetical protein
MATEFDWSDDRKKREIETVARIYRTEQSDAA